MSGKCRGWAGEQKDAPRELRTFLMVVADYANELGFMWPSVETMADEQGCSGRTIQRLLKKAVEAGLLIRLDVEDRRTGRTRSCGYFFPVKGLGPTGQDIAAFERVSGGRVTAVSPWEGDTGVTGEGDTGVRGRVTTVSPHEPPLEPSETEVSSPGAREDGETPVGKVDRTLVEAVRAAMPVGMGRVSSEPDWIEALDVLAGRGEDVSAVPDCLRRLADDPLFRGLKVPPRCERWLLDGKWRFYLDPAPPRGPDASRLDPGLLRAGEFAPWCAAMAAVQARIGDKLFRSWLSRASLGQIGQALYLVAATGVARDWIRDECWPLIFDTFEAADPQRRRLTLVAKPEFEALVRLSQGADDEA
ncbi:MAG: helix-turn-helix domain-containing protein [Phenylobacterium sp.]|nr:helix-turn-helix domain-containing protein [Phenylobacterium sp.]